MRSTLTAPVLILASPAWANTPSPHADMANRPICALSAGQKADLLAGRGMGLAQAAKLNAEQIAAYANLRGHAGVPPQHGGAMPGGHRHH